MGVNFTGGEIITSGGESDGYLRDLWGMTAKASNLVSHVEHPDFPAASAGGIQSSPSTVLYPKDEATRLNIEYQNQNPTHDIKPYHEARPIISYRTDTDTDNMSRVHGSSNQVREWTTRTSDIQDPDGDYNSPGQIKNDLNLNNVPTEVSPVHPQFGTDILASRPISGKARQYQLLQKAESWFGPSKKLG